MFPLRALCFILSLSQTPQLPSTLVYCISLIVLSSRSCIPLRRIHLLVYISPVLVATNLRTNITYFSLVSVWGSSEHSDPPVRLRLSLSPLVLISFLRHTFWWGQLIAVRRTRLFVLPRYVRIRSDPNVTSPQHSTTQIYTTRERDAIEWRDRDMTQPMILVQHNDEHKWWKNGMRENT